MSNFYVVVFLVGVFYTIISSIISGISGSLHSHGDFGADIGHHGHIDGGHIDSGHIDSSSIDAGHIDTGNIASGHIQTDTGHAIHTVDGSHFGDVDGQHGHSSSDVGTSHSVLSWFAVLINPLVAVSFLTVFGGIGILGTNYFKWLDVMTFIVAAAAGIVCSTLLYNFVAKPIYRSENTSNVSREMLIGTAAEVTTDILANGFGTISYTVNSLKFNAPSKHIEGKSVKQGQKVVICEIKDNVFYITELSNN